MVKDAYAQLGMKIRELSQKITKTYAENKVPADYSLGVVNGLILAEHILCYREGNPRCFDRTTSIGAFPKPVVLRSGNALKDDATYQSLLDRVLLSARNLAGGILPREGLVAAIEDLDHFTERRIEELANQYEAHRED